MGGVVVQVSGNQAASACIGGGQGRARLGVISAKPVIDGVNLNDYAVIAIHEKDFWMDLSPGGGCDNNAYLSGRTNGRTAHGEFRLHTVAGSEPLGSFDAVRQ
jgi:hypothetical protein